MNETNFTLRSRITSFKYAIDGIASLIKNEHNSRIHLIAAVLAIILGLLLHLSLLEWVSITIVIGLVFITELINSTIELIADFIDHEANPGIKQIKDYAAASVLISAIIAIIVGGLVFAPRIIGLIK